MITYVKQLDGTFVKAGAFAEVPSEVRIQVGDARPFSGSYTLAQATAIIEDAIAKNQVVKEKYAILPMEVKEPKAAKEPKQPKEPKAPKAAKTPAEPKAPRVVKYEKSKLVEIYNVNHSLDEVVSQTGASRVYAHRVLVQMGVWVTPVRAAKAEIVLTEAEVIRVNAIQTETNVDRVAAIKQLRKEQRIAARPPKEAKAPRVLKYSKDDFVRIYLVNHSLDEVISQTGASRVWAQRVLVQKNVWVKPVAKVAEVVAPVATPAPKEAKAPKVAAPKAAVTPKPAKKSKPNQVAPPVETTSTQSKQLRPRRKEFASPADLQSRAAGRRVLNGAQSHGLKNHEAPAHQFRARKETVQAAQEHYPRRQADWRDVCRNATQSHRVRRIQGIKLDQRQ